MNLKQKNQKKTRRSRRARARLFGTADRPRLSVFRSNKHIFLQLIDDDKGRTLASARDNDLKNVSKKTKTEKAELTGIELAKKAKSKKISKIIFDKSSYKYHGRVKAIAEGARKEGLKF